jgi:hypothetical protein
MGSYLLQLLLTKDDIRNKKKNIKENNTWNYIVFWLCEK